MKILIMGHGGSVYHTTKETLTRVGNKEESVVRVLKKVHNVCTTYSLKEEL